MLALSIGRWGGGDKLIAEQTAAGFWLAKDWKKEGRWRSSLVVVGCREGGGVTGSGGKQVRSSERIDGMGGGQDRID